jgi:NADH dehydrogenase
LNERPQVVIIGAGFGGLWAARALAGSPADILLIDRNNYHTFLPLLYQVAAAELSPADITYPVRSILRRFHNVHFVMEEVIHIDFLTRQVKAGEYVFPYDYLILSPGSVAHDFGLPGVAKNAFQLKTIDQAIRLRNHLLLIFEHAVYEKDPSKREQLLTFTIAGGGPTGVEFAGALAELVRGPLLKDYPDIDAQEVKIILLEAASSLLVGFPERLQAYAQAHLQKMGIEIRLGAAVSQVTENGVMLSGEKHIPTKTVVWTAGVRSELPAYLGNLPRARNGQVEVLPTLQTPDYPEVYVIGDLARVIDQGNPLPLVAPVAIQQSKVAVANLLRQIQGQQPLPFKYRDPGTMVTIGRNAAVAQLKGRSFTGFIAWMIWLGVHIFNLIGYRNRLVVVINWAWDYLFYERAVRLIIPLGRTDR